MLFRRAKPRFCAREALGPDAPVRAVATSGNHDCDFDTAPTPARTTLIELMAKSPGLVTDPATAAACVAVQRAFFAFRDAHAAEGLMDPDARQFYDTTVTALPSAQDGEILRWAEGWRTAKAALTAGDVDAVRVRVSRFLSSE